MQLHVTIKSMIIQVTLDSLTWPKSWYWSAVEPLYKDTPENEDTFFNQDTLNAKLMYKRGGAHSANRKQDVASS